MKMFIPTSDDYMRLTKDWVFKSDPDTWQWRLLKALYPTESDDPDWQKREKFLHSRPDVVIPAGTVFQIRNIGFRVQGPKILNIKIVDSPNKALVSKSFGGTMSGGVQFYTKRENGQDAEFELADPKDFQ